MRHYIIHCVLALMVLSVQVFCLAQDQLPRKDIEPSFQVPQDISSLTSRIHDLNDEVKALKKRSEDTSIAALSALAAIGAALLTGIFAILNQRRQAIQQRLLTAQEAEQERLLKAIEIIMQSRNRYEARIRVQNLDPFLTPLVKTHLESMLAGRFDKKKPGFSGPEWIQLRIKMAETMAAKAKDADEVYRIWQQLLADKSAVADVTWPGVSGKL
ncbi:MAG: hypothetical protein JWQ69_5929 [Pseudomonas sp.]|nr:hypothetical protein [Pseudomonas sp.]